MEVSVMRRHIRDAKCGDPRRRMMARAIRDTWPYVSYALVRTNGITITETLPSGRRTRYRYMVPLIAARAIVNFDAGKEVLPFKCRLKLVDMQGLPPRTETDKTRDRLTQKKKRIGIKAGTHKPEKRSRVSGV